MRLVCGMVAVLAVMAGGLAAASEGGVVVHRAALSKQEVAPGEKISIEFVFEAPDGPMAEANSVFVHIRKEDGDMVNQADHKPKVATDSQGWDGRIRYSIDYTVPENLADGVYRIMIGLYHKGGDGKWVNEKLALGEGVTAFTGNSYIVGQFTVRK